MPADLCEQFNINIKDYGSENFIESCKPVVEILCNKALQLNNVEFDKIDKKLKKSAKSILCYKFIAQNRLAQIKNNNYNLFSSYYNPYLSIKTLFKIYFI
jgi:hypothetical protein